MPSCEICGKSDGTKRVFLGRYYSTCDECADRLSWFSGTVVTPELVIDAFGYLSELRDGGTVNMFGASDELQRNWAGMQGIKITRMEANKLLIFWIATYKAKT